MARANKLYEKPRVTSLATGDLFSTGQLQPDGTYKVKTITKENARASLLAPIEIGYDELVALSGSYEIGKEYQITDAPIANLIVEAIAVNKIGSDAKDPALPLNTVKYDFANNTVLSTNTNIANGTLSNSVKRIARGSSATSDIARVDAVFEFQGGNDEDCLVSFFNKTLGGSTTKECGTTYYGYNSANTKIKMASIGVIPITKDAGNYRCKIFIAPDLNDTHDYQMTFYAKRGIDVFQNANDGGEPGDKIFRVVGDIRILTPVDGGGFTLQSSTGSVAQNFITALAGSTAELNFRDYQGNAIGSLFSNLAGNEFRIGSNGAGRVFRLYGGNNSLSMEMDGNFVDVKKPIKLSNTVTASIATPSTHKVEVSINGSTYYLLATT